MKKFIILRLTTGSYVRAASTEKAYAIKPFKELFFLSKKYCRLVELPPSLNDTYRWCLEIPEWYAEKHENVQTAIKETQEATAMLDAFIEEQMNKRLDAVREYLHEINKNKKP
jgi:hypothetical protein